MPSSSFCQHCIDLHELPGTPQGTADRVGDVPVYLSKGLGETQINGTLVIATDVYGLGIVNPKIVADLFAQKTGMNVVVPDLFPHGPVKPGEFVLPGQASKGPPSEETMKQNLQRLTAWMESGNQPDRTYPLLESVIKHFGEKQGPIGVIGYCYGMWTALEKHIPTETNMHGQPFSSGAKLAAFAGRDPDLVTAIVMYHPSLLELQDAKEIKTPTLLNTAEQDPIFQGELEHSFRAGLNSQGVLDSRSRMYPNTVHNL